MFKYGTPSLAFGAQVARTYIEYLHPEWHPKLFDWYNTYTLFFVWILKYLSLGLVLEYSSTWVLEYLSTRTK